MASALCYANWRFAGKFLTIAAYQTFDDCFNYIIVSAEEIVEKFK